MQFNRKTYLILIVIVLAIFAAVLSFPGVFHPGSKAATPTFTEDDLARQAAILGATAFFTIDEQGSQQVWIENLCRVSTESGCAFHQLGLDKLWKQFEAAHTSITPTILQAEKVQLAKNSTGMQVWKVTIELSRALPGRSDKQDTAYALVMAEQGGWKFDRFLLPAEVNGLVE